MKDPKHLAKGWVGWNFKKSLGKPTRVINDAAMQALGSYRGGRMLFLGLGTGLGSTLIWERNVLPLELGDLPYGDGGTIEDHLGKRGLDRYGRKDWDREVEAAVARLKLAFIADYVVLGGGNAKLLGPAAERLSARAQPERLSRRETFVADRPADPAREVECDFVGRRGECARYSITMLRIDGGRRKLRIKPLECRHDSLQHDKIARPFVVRRRRHATELKRSCIVE